MEFRRVLFRSSYGLASDAREDTRGLIRLRFQKTDKKCQKSAEKAIKAKRRVVTQNSIKKAKSSELAFAAPWLVPSPRYFAKSNLLRTYCSGVRPWQVDSAPMAAPVGCTRTTASSNEQKLRIPVWFSVIGTAAAK